MADTKPEEMPLTLYDEENIREMLPLSLAMGDSSVPRYWLTTAARLLREIDAERAAHAVTKRTAADLAEMGRRQARRR